MTKSTVLPAFRWEAAIPIEPGEAALYRAWHRSLAALGLDEEAKRAYPSADARSSEKVSLPMP